MSDLVEIAGRMIDRWNRADFDSDLPDVDPEVEIDWSESKAPYAGTYRGHAGWNELFRHMNESFEHSWAEVHEYIVVGPHVAVRNTGHLRGRGGIEVIARSTLVFTFRDDRIIEARLFQEHSDALAAIQASA